jgi:photosystem II stability/assembly factor-like uncharacterized protein/PKD repeat protein
MMKNFTLFILLLICTSVFSQSIRWEDKLKQKDANFFETKKLFDDQWKDKEITKGSGYTPFMRMANWIEPRVFPSGNISLASPLKAYNEYQKYIIDNNNHTSSVCQGNWTSVGPTMYNDTALWTKEAIGRINCVAVNPFNSQTFYLGTPAGGLWKTIDGGATYTNYTDNLDYFGFSSVAIARTDTNIVYAGTGDRFSYDMPTLGLIKSTDAGLTWQHVSSFPNNQISKILINPLNAQSIIISTYSGLFKSFNGGLSWISSFTMEAFYDLEYKPGDTAIIYATTGSTFYKSTDAGATFNSVVGTGIDFTSLNNALIAVSSSDPNFVAVATITSAHSIKVYTSINLGATFTSNGMTAISEAQSWYNFAFDVSPTNKLEIVVCGVRLRTSSNGGATFAYTNWDIHADVHDVCYSEDGSKLYVCTDGGIFIGTNASQLYQFNGNMDISQIYSLGVSKTSAGKVAIGLQDNGSQFVTTPAQIWTGYSGGDGMECFFDPTDDNIIYSSFQGGNFARSINNGVYNFPISNGLFGSSIWEEPWCLDPNNPAILYCARGPNFFKSTDAGITWLLLSSFPGSSSCREFELSKANSLCIYALLSSSMVKSIDGGVTWTTLPLSVFSTPKCIAINPLDQNDVIVCLGGQVNHVNRTLDGGTTFINLSAGLPDVSANSVIFDANPSNGFYVGTDVGVFYYVQSSGSYLSFNQGIPFVPITEMELDLLGNKIYAATYGRGLWKADMFDASSCPPIANFSLSDPACGLTQVTFSNSSFLSPVSYSWSFPGGVPATSTAINPVINYATNGAYTATLIATNAFGSDTTFQSFSIGGLSSFPIVEGFTGTAFPPTSWIINSNSSDPYNWEKTTSYGGFGLSYESMTFNNWTNNTSGAHHHMVSPPMNCSNVTNFTLNFDVAYHKFNSSDDSLLVSVSTDCGTSWNQVYGKGSTQLETALVGTANPFHPTSSQWRTETINLNYNSAFLLFRFTNVGDFGNAVYVDNINLDGMVITGFESESETTLFNLFPNPTNELLHIEIQNRNNKFILQNLLGETLMMKNEVPETLNLNHLAAGIYVIKIGSISKKIIKK